jgi:hypothetical protein
MVETMTISDIRPTHPYLYEILKKMFDLVDAAIFMVRRKGIGIQKMACVLSEK